MGTWSHRIHCRLGLCGVVLFLGCGSSDEVALTVTDAASPADVPVTPDPDAPIQIVDAPVGLDGARPDGHYFTIPDGRQFLEVEYCLPILPLSSASTYCPSTVDEAEVEVRNALDGGVADGRPYLGGGPEIVVSACVEPLVVYLPHGRSLGWGAVCYYDAASGRLVSANAGTDTPTECADSPIPNTAAFIAKVYGQYITCTRPRSGGGG